MNYDLAKRLKEAGFPQDLSDGYPGIKSGREGYDDKGRLHVFDDGFWRGGNATTTIPTLSELIEACPRSLHSPFWHINCDFQLWSVNGKWLAVYHWIDGTCHEVCDDLKETDTPEEAVAELWLKLHEKETK